MKHGRDDYDSRIQDSAGIIPDDEPVFLIRGQDILATKAMKQYVMLLRERATQNPCNERMYNMYIRQAKRVENQLHEIECWQNSGNSHNFIKWPDV